MCPDTNTIVKEEGEAEYWDCCPIRDLPRTASVANEQYDSVWHRLGGGQMLLSDFSTKFPTDCSLIIE